jgi:hypothetical protein
LGGGSGLHPAERLELEVALATGHSLGKLTDEESRIARNALA